MAKATLGVRARTGWLVGVLVACVATAGLAMAQGSGEGGGTAAEAIQNVANAKGGVSLKDLFLQSFDLFTVLLLLGSLVAWTVIIVSIIEIRKNSIVPQEPEDIIRRLAKARLWGDLRQFVVEDDAFVCKVVRAAVRQPGDDKDAIREAAELAAGEECARWFRKIEPLNIIGNLGPLLGLAGTVWGMVIAFAALGQAGGEANPSSLSAGIAKALFHTLLGLLLAVPALCVFGFYRGVIDRLCTRAMVISAELVELLPSEAALRCGEPGAPGSAAGGANNAAARQPAARAR